MKKIELFEGVYKINNSLATKNLVPGIRVYGEKLIKVNNEEYREWDFYKSKLAAAIKKGLKIFPFKKNSKLLYLGASTGTTVSHLSDVIVNGEIFAVEFAQRPMRDLLLLCQKRENIIPIFADAFHPEKYFEEPTDLKVDIIYQDVAQPNQAEILIKNAQLFLRQGGDAFLCIKSQSIDVLKNPKEVYQETIKQLEKGGFRTLQTIELDPFDKDHLFWYGKFH
ncbi:MAG: fibrillarin-like rRNA/tRNA 2'-O-methyltransferase [Candidatus Anstonellaceae archaeon]